MIFIMAWRNIWRNKMRSIVIMLSVSIGLFAGIAVLALYKGMMRSRVRTVIDAEISHIQIHQKEFKKDYDPAYTLQAGDSIQAIIRRMKQVKFVARRSITQGMLNTPTGSAGVQINGIEPDIEYQTSQLREKIIKGEGFHSDKKNEILIGKKLADKMKLKTASKLVLTFTDTAGNIVSAAFRVAGIYQSQNAPLDEVVVYVELRTLSALLLVGNSFHEIAILLKDDDDLLFVQRELEQRFPGYLVESWKQISPETELLVKTVDEYSYIIIIIILFALAFGIVNTMLMAILERTREIGMMVALGTTKSKVFLLVLFETILLTIAGTPLGLLAALVVTGYYHKHGLDLSGMGKDMMASFGFNTIVYPSFPIEKLLAIMLLVAGTAIVASLLPALKALRLEAVKALRR